MSMEFYTASQFSININPRIGVYEFSQYHTNPTFDIRMYHLYKPQSSLVLYKPLTPYTLWNINISELRFNSREALHDTCNMSLSFKDFGLNAV